MFLSIYGWLLRLPHFKGKSRLVESYRKFFFSPSTCTIVHGLRMNIDGFDWIQSDILRDGCTEPKTCELMGEILREGDTYVDVGAQIGLHTLVARHFVGAKGRIIAVEPQPYNCHKILTNWRLNEFENLTLHVAAVGNANGLACLHLQSAEDTSRLSLCLTPVNDQPQTFQVPIRPLETILESVNGNQIKLLKMDIEGYELEAIQGLGKYIDQIDNIIVELLDSDKALERKSQSLIQLLKSHGYDLRSVEGNPWDGSGQALIENNLWASRSAVQAS